MGLAESEIVPISEEVRRILRSGGFAHLATVMRNGAPHVVPVWVDCVGDDIVFLKEASSIGARNIRRDSRIAMSVSPPGEPYVVVGLRAVVTETRRGPEAVEWLQDTSMRYTGAEWPYPGEAVMMIARPVRIWVRSYLEDSPSGVPTGPTEGVGISDDGTTDTASPVP